MWKFMVLLLHRIAASLVLPLIAEDALKDLLFEEIERGVIKLGGCKYAVGIQPGLKTSIDAIQVKQ
jgi:hypothetical protein